MLVAVRCFWILWTAMRALAMDVSALSRSTHLTRARWYPTIWRDLHHTVTNTNTGSAPSQPAWADLYHQPSVAANRTKHDLEYDLCAASLLWGSLGI
jgi:hypothetical protein